MVAGADNARLLRERRAASKARSIPRTYTMRILRETAFGRSGERFQKGDHAGEDLRAGGDDVALVQVIGFAAELADDAARLGHE